MTPFVISPRCFPLPFPLPRAKVRSPSLSDQDLELSSASDTFRFPGETERLFDVLAIVERDSAPLSAFAAVANAAAAARCAARAASRCDDKAKADRLLGLVILIVATLERAGRPELAAISPSESDMMRPKVCISITTG